MTDSQTPTPQMIFLPPAKPYESQLPMLQLWHALSGGQTPQEPTQYIVIENTPGYLPDDADPYVTTDYASAVEAVNERAAEYADDPDANYRVEYGWASGDNLTAVMVYDDDKTHDLGRYIGVEILQD